MEMVGIVDNRAVRSPFANPAANRSRAFTLVELLVTIGVIAILSSLLLPTLAQAKGRGQQIYCLNNFRQLAIATLLYAPDHNERLPYNLGATEIGQILRDGKHYNWANSVLDWSDRRANTNIFLNTAASLGPYVAKRPEIYRCPNDHTVSSNQRRLGWDHRSRSYSMNAMVGDPGAFLQGGANVNNPYQHQFLSLAEFSAPSTIFVFVEEHPDSINDGYFINKAYAGEWTDLPASYHSGGANLSYADGHEETHRWLRSTTKQPHKPDGADLPMLLEKDDRADYNWLMSRMSVH